MENRFLHKIRRKTTFFTSAIYMFSCQKVFRDTGHNHCRKHQSYLCVTCSKTMPVLRLNIYTWSCRFFITFSVYFAVLTCFLHFYDQIHVVSSLILDALNNWNIHTQKTVYFCVTYVIQRVSVMALGWSY